MKRRAVAEAVGENVSSRQRTWGQGAPAASGPQHARPHLLSRVASATVLALLVLGCESKPAAPGTSGDPLPPKAEPRLQAKVEHLHDALGPSPAQRQVSAAPGPLAEPASAAASAELTAAGPGSVEPAGDDSLRDDFDVTEPTNAPVRALRLAPASADEATPAGPALLRAAGAHRRASLTRAEANSFVRLRAAIERANAAAERKKPHLPLD